MTRKTARPSLPAGLLAPLLALCACALVHERAQDEGPISRPAGDEGMLMYTVGRLSFQAPADWEAQGDPRHVLLVDPENEARIDAQVVDRVFKDDRECLAHAEDSLARGSAKLTNVRRHPTTLAGRRAVVQEADQAGWHGWAWAMCDGREQYRVFFTGRSPLDGEAVRASRLVASSAVLAVKPGA
jgi:hypothetical protein